MIRTENRGWRSPAFAAAAIALVLVAVLLAPRPADANPTFARMTGHTCAVCHVPAQEPLLNATGQEFKSCGFSFCKGPPSAAAQPVPQPPSPAPIAPALPKGTVSWSTHANLAIHCGPNGCISGGPGCDTQAVGGQCSFPKAQAQALCGAHPACVAVTCNPGRNDCQARDTAVLTATPGFTSYITWTRYSDLAVNCGPNGCLSAGPGCDTQAVGGQCSLPKGEATALCATLPGCVAVNCNSSRNDCQARNTTRLEPWKGMDSYIKGRPGAPK
jgi:hypothetical protein